MNLKTLIRLKAASGKSEPVRRNLFDEANAPMYLRYIAMTSQAATESDWMVTDDGRTFSMPVKPNTDYAVSVFNTSVSIFRVACLTVDPSTVGDEETLHSYNTKAFNTGRTGTIKTGANEKWIVIQVNKTYAENRNAKIQVEYGTVKTEPYEPYIH